MNSCLGSSLVKFGRELVMIKVVLNSYPLYQCSILLAPSKFLAKIERMLRSFFWKGGKNGGGKKFALFSWNKIKMSWMEGGLQIRDLKFQNLTMGAKLLWNLIDKNPSWSSQVIWNKYFIGPRLICLDINLANKQGSSIFSLCKKALPRFKEDLHWIPGNGKQIKLL